MNTKGTESMWLDTGLTNEWKDANVANMAIVDVGTEDTQRRILGETGDIIAADETDAATTIGLIGAEDSDKITAAGLDNTGKCIVDSCCKDDKCMPTVTSTTSTATTDGEATSAAPETSAAPAAFMTYGFGFFALLVAGINIL